MSLVTSLHKIINSQKKRIFSKPNGQILLSGTSLLTLAACGGDTIGGSLNIITGSASADMINGTYSNDIILAGGGDDTIFGSEGNDYVDGGDGDDTMDYSGSAQGVYAYLDGSVAGNGSINGFDLDNLNNIENLEGSAFNDILVGNSGGNTIDGGAGDDQISGGSGDDILIGGLGDDIIFGGDGADQVDGGDGIDWVVFGGTEGVTVTLDGSVSSGGEAAGDTYINIENIRGTDYDDVLTGNISANIIQALDGDDILNGLAGNDQLEGGFGDDQINGGDGVDLAVFNADSFNYVINKAGNKIQIVATIDSVTTTDYLNSIETINNHGTIIDVKDIWTALDGAAQAQFAGGEADFLAWLGADAGYNYEGL